MSFEPRNTANGWYLMHTRVAAALVVTVAVLVGANGSGRGTGSGKGRCRGSNAGSSTVSDDVMVLLLFPRFLRGTLGNTLANSNRKSFTKPSTQ